MEGLTERYFAVTVFGYDKETNNPISLLIPFTIRLGRYINNRTMLELAQGLHPDAILLHISNIQEFRHSDDMLDFIAEPPEQTVTFNSEDRGKLMRDGEAEPFFFMSQSLTPMRKLPFFEQYDEEMCKHCGEEEIDPDFFPYCGEICRLKGKNEE